jgi:hypothetical protein
VHCVTARLAEKFMLGFQFDFDDGWFWHLSAKSGNTAQFAQGPIILSENVEIYILSQHTMSKALGEGLVFGLGVVLKPVLGSSKASEYMGLQAYGRIWTGRIGWA